MTTPTPAPSTFAELRRYLVETIVVPENTVQHSETIVGITALSQKLGLSAAYIRTMFSAGDGVFWRPAPGAGVKLRVTSIDSYTAKRG